MLLGVVGFYRGLTVVHRPASQYIKSGCMAKQSIILPPLTCAYRNALSLLISARPAALGRPNLQSGLHHRILSVVSWLA